MKKWYRSEYLSIPNLIGYFRILLIPLYLALYFRAETEKDYLIAAAVIGISGLTDCFDGKIARRFHMVTEFGKLLDPVADKLTQGALVLSLTFRYPFMLWVLVLFVVKEAYMAAMGALMLKKGRRMDGAQRCGKVCTAVLYAVMFLLILFTGIPIAAANVLMLVSMGFMVYSLMCYIGFYGRMWRELKGKEARDTGEAGEMKENGDTTQTGDTSKAGDTKQIGETTQTGDTSKAGETKQSGDISEAGKAGRRKKKVWAAVLIVLAMIAYMVLGAALPYRRQPAVSDGFASAFDPASFYGEGTSCDRAMVIRENGAALDERLRLIAAAQERIILSTFAFESDEAGKDMLAALQDAADRGVDVKILADGFNSVLYMEQNPYFYALSARPNVEIRIYNQVNPLTPWTSMGRMHDKYLIADDLAYILGGRNTFGYFLGDYEGHKNHDWDVLVYNTGADTEPLEEIASNRKRTDRDSPDTDGPVSQESSLRQVEDYFYSVWELDVCRTFHDSERLSDRVSVKKASGELEERFARIRQEKPELYTHRDYATVTCPVHKITLISGPAEIWPKEPQVFHALTRLMENARENVYVHTPYVICNDAMYDAFTKVAQSVPEFQLMTNSAVNNGNPFAAGDYLLNKHRLLETGVQILEYEGGISYHGKCLAIDDDIAAVGSFNMDVRSAYLDTELMLVVHGEEFNASLREQMESYEDKAFTVTGENTWEEKAGMVKKEMPPAQRRKLQLIRFFAGWARFLL